MSNETERDQLKFTWLDCGCVVSLLDEQQLVICMDHVRNEDGVTGHIRVLNEEGELQLISIDDMDEALRVIARMLERLDSHGRTKKNLETLMSDGSIFNKIDVLTVGPSTEGFIRQKFMYSVEDVTMFLFRDHRFNMVEISLTVDEDGKTFVNFIAEREDDE